MGMSSPPSSLWPRLALTWLIYTVTGVASVYFAAANDFVSPLYLAAGLGLACVLGWGPRVLWAVGLGGASVSVFYQTVAAPSTPLPLMLTLAVLVGLGAGLQAWAAQALTRARDGQDLSLENPGQILRFLLLAGPLACLVSAGVATTATVLVGGLPAEQALRFAFNWWAGDTLGVLIGTPMLLPLVGQPAALWRPRRRVVSIPLLVTTVLLTLAVRQLNAWHQERQYAVFLQSVEATTSAVQLRLHGYLHAVEALNGLMDASEEVSRVEFHRATRYWLGALDSVQALGWEERVARADLPAFEAAQRLEGLPGYRVYDGIERRPPQGDEVLALRFIEPQSQNLRALGYNVLSRPETRSTYERARDTDTLQATQGFQLIQETGMQQGVVIYRPVYDGEPQTVSERRQTVRGALFLTLRMDDALASILRDMPAHLAACLYESHPLGERLLGGTPACVHLDARHPPRHLQRVPVAFAGQTWTLAVWARGPIPMAGDGATFWLLAVVGALLATALGTLLLVMTGHARSLQDAMEEARRQHAVAEQANRAKSDFLSRMSHELRTPLNAVLGFAQVMELDTSAPLPPSQRRRVQQIQQAGWHLLDMIDDVLDISRLDSGNMRLNCAPMPVSDALEAALSMVQDKAQKQGITLQGPGPVPADWGVHADATRLRQILTNLLSNAIKYNRPHGSVTVSVSRQVDSAHQATLRVAVSDTGLGMSPAQQAQLFQPFNRLGREHSQTEGTGIGLVISRHLAELMHGTLEVASQADVGSTFTLVLPAVSLVSPASETPSALPPSDTAPPAPGPRHVLYVEDNPTNSELLREGLRARQDLSVSVAATAEEALDWLHNPARGPRPDLILLDLHLPDASGMEVLRLLKANPDTAGIPVIMVSADAMPEQMQAALDAGAHSYLTKPVHLPTLLRSIDALLHP
jgi:signal transduction histidine kinase/ActR/RegA family two-component response regulator/integral membrane sensor domain MASE1